MKNKMLILDELLEYMEQNKPSPICGEDCIAGYEYAMKIVKDGAVYGPPRMFWRGEEE